MAGLKRAKDLNLINFATFDIQLYQYHERVENGDLNIVVPGKYVAFSGPAATRQEIDHGVYTWAPENYTNIFKQLNVTTVVRLNKKSYDRRQFTDNGFKHVEMYVCCPLPAAKNCDTSPLGTSSMAASPPSRSFVSFSNFPSLTPA
jgi:cell division cycle 14